MKIIIQTFILCLVLSISLRIKGNHQIDSLKNIISSANADTVKIQALIKLSRLYVFTYPDSSLICTDEILDIANRMKSQRYIYQGYWRKAVAYYVKGEFPKAIEFYTKALEICKLLKRDDEIARCKINIGAIYHKQGYYYLALKNYIEAIIIKEKTGNYEGGVYNNVAEIYFEQGQYDKAIPYYKKSLEIYIEAKDEQGIAYCINFEGDMLFKDKKYDKAIEKYKKALKTYVTIEDRQGSAIQYKKLGLSYFNLKDFSLAKKYFQSAVDVTGEDNDQKEKAFCLNYLGKIYAHDGDLTKAIEYSKKSLQIATQISSKVEKSNAYQSLYNHYLILNNPSKALEYYILYSEAQDSIIAEKNSRQINELGIQYETEKKEKELVLLSKENEVQKLRIARSRRIVYASVGFILLIIIISILFVQQYRLKQKQKSVELEQRLLRAQMNPHFIFNSLIAIQNYILKNKSLEAGEYLSDFAVLMRSILDNSRKEYVSLESELEFLNHYLTLQKMRFSNKFDYKIDVADEIELAETGIPPMLAQPFIENSIEHGFTNKKEKGMIDVRFFKENGSIIFELEDNGIGREQAQKHKKRQHESFAIEITTKRIENLNKHSKQRYRFNIIDLKSGEGTALGTKVTFKIPLFYI